MRYVIKKLNFSVYLFIFFVEDVNNLDQSILYF